MSFWTSWEILHPLSGNGYQFWSGIGSDFSELSILVALILLVKHHNCHVVGCKRLGHHDPEAGAPACWEHHSQGHKQGRSHRHHTAPHPFTAPFYNGGDH